MTLKVCPQCGYPYNAPENQTCGKCKGWLGGAPATGAAAAVAPRRSTLVPRNLAELACYLPVLLMALWNGPNPFGAAFGLLMAGFLLKAARVEMNRFSKGLLLGIVVGGVFFAYLIFLLIFGLIYLLVEPLLEPIIRLFKH
jgi:hypothetical protein